MIPVLYESTETLFTTNGLGGLPDGLSGKVQEQRNGIYELTMVYPVTGLHYDLLQIGRIIYATHDDTRSKQPFRIYRMSKVINGKVTVNARHISYDLMKIPCAPFTAGSCSAALLGISENSVISPCPFTFWTDKAVTADFALLTPMAIRSVLGGSEGSILDVYGKGEYEFDHFTVKLHLNRGQDSGVSIRYGKNLTEMEDETDGTDTITGVYPYWEKDGEYVDLPEKVVWATPHDDRVAVLDCSDRWESAPSESDLRSYAEAYIATNTGVIKNSVKVSFVQLWQTEEYKAVAALQRVKLCDTVSVEHPKLGVSVKTQVVEVVYDFLRDRYESMTLGEPSTSMTDAVNAEIAVETKTLAQKSFVSSAVAAATLLIQGGLGGHVVINTNADGQPEEILIMDTDDKNTATNVIRMNMAGIGFSRNGYAGEYTTAWTLDGHFVADFVDTGTLTANLIKAGTLTDPFGRFFLDLATGQFYFNATGANVGGRKVASEDDISDTMGAIETLRTQEVAANETAINEILQWIAFDPVNGLRIGEDQTGYSVRIKANEIGFYVGAARMAYISNKQLFIEDVQIQQSLKFGISTPEWAFVPRANGNLSFRYIGG